MTPSQDAYPSLHIPERRSNSMAETILSEAIRSGQRTLQKYGLGTFIAICSVAFLMYLIVVQIRGIRDDTAAAARAQSDVVQRLRDDLREHMWQTSFYMQQVCRNTALQSGADVRACDMPQMAR